MGSGAVSGGGWQLTRAPDTIWHPSPNFGPRRDGLNPDLIVLHYTAMHSADAAIARLCDPDCEVSAHYLICADGSITQMVDEAMRAWHAGAGEWQGRGDINSRSIGIELDNDGASPFTAALMDALERLLPGIMTRWAIPASGIIGHSDMAPGRKADPGCKFDWQRLARQGLAAPAGTKTSPPEMNLFRKAAQRIGYGPDISDDLLLETVRLRFRPGVAGPLCADDMRVVSG